MNVEHVDMPSGYPVTDAYVKRSDGRLAGLFGSHPEAAGDWRARADWLRRSESLRADRRQVAEALAAFNRKAGASAATNANVEALGTGAFAVVGGQQAGLLTGPVMVIHKAVSVVNAAKWAEKEVGCKVVPVFWIAGEDHDWDEANHACLVTAGSVLKKLAVGREGRSKTSVSRTKLDPGTWSAVLGELADSLPDTEFKPELLESLKLAASASDTLTELFARIMASLFAKEGLVLIDADDPALRRLEAPMFIRMLEKGEELERAYASGSSGLSELGYALQVEPQPGCANLFVYRDPAIDPNAGRLEGERVLLYRKDGGMFTDRKETFAVSQPALLALAAETPELFSNNVLTRPLMQDYVLPVLATVVGPAEIAYWAQLGEAFRSLGMAMPIVLPRTSYTVTDDGIRKYMDVYGLSFDDVRNRFDERKQAWLDERDTLSLDELFEETERRIADLYEPLLQALPAIEAGLADIGEKNRRKIVEQVRFLRAKAKDAHRLRFEAELRRFDRVAVWLRPDGKPQERVINYASMWNRYGSHWLDSLLAVPCSRSGGHYIIHL